MCAKLHILTLIQQKQIIYLPTKKPVFFADENNSDMNIQNCLNGSGLERCLAGIEKIENSCFFLLFCCMLEKKCTFANSWLRQRKEKRMDYQDVKDGTTVTTPPAITD